jgi:hypothetical protein
MSFCQTHLGLHDHMGDSLPTDAQSGSHCQHLMPLLMSISLLQAGIKCPN